MLMAEKGNGLVAMRAIALAQLMVPGWLIDDFRKEALSQRMQDAVEMGKYEGGPIKLNEAGIAGTREGEPEPLTLADVQRAPPLARKVWVRASGQRAGTRT